MLVHDCIFIFLFLWKKKKNFITIISEPQGTCNNNILFYFIFFLNPCPDPFKSKALCHKLSIALEQCFLTLLLEYTQHCRFLYASLIKHTCFNSSARLQRRWNGLENRLRATVTFLNQSVFERIGWMNDSVTCSLVSLLNGNAQTRMRVTKGKFLIVLLARILWLDRHYCMIMKKKKLPFAVIDLFFSLTFLGHASMLLLGRWENQVNIQSGQ